MSVDKDLVDILKAGDFLLIEPRFDFMMLFFESKGNKLDNFREAGLRVEEVSFDVGMG